MPLLRSRSHFSVVAGPCLVAFALRVAVSSWFPSIDWPDEVFQSLEQAHRLVFGYGIVPWEFRTGVRSWILPGALAGLMQIGRWFGPLGHVRAAQMALMALSVIPVAVTFLWSHRRDGRLAAFAGSAVCVVWFELLYFAPRALNEVVAAHLLLVALFLLSERHAKSAKLAAAGAALGLAVVLRMHLGPAIGVAVLVMVGRDGRRWCYALGAAATVLLIAGVLDWITWGAPFASFWTNFRINVIEGRSHDYGIAPWYDYAERIVRVWSWAGVPLLALAGIGATRRPALAAAAVLSLATHSLLAHKEYRFVYPTLMLVAVLASQGTAMAVAWLVNQTRQRWQMGRAVQCGAVTLVVLGWTALSAWRAVQFQSGGGASLWLQGRAGLQTLARAHTDPDICGLAMVRLRWVWTGGYTYLHRDLPIYIVATQQEFEEVAPAVNAVLVPRSFAPIPGYTVEHCARELCIAKRRGGCLPVSAPKINAQLATWGA